MREALGNIGSMECWHETLKPEGRNRGYYGHNSSRKLLGLLLSDQAQLGYSLLKRNQRKGSY